MAVTLTRYAVGRVDGNNGALCLAAFPSAAACYSCERSIPPRGGTVIYSALFFLLLKAPTTCPVYLHFGLNSPVFSSSFPLLPVPATVLFLLYQQMTFYTATTPLYLLLRFKFPSSVHFTLRCGGSSSRYAARMRRRVLAPPAYACCLPMVSACAATLHAVTC